MSGYLLDTHSFLWWLADDPALGRDARRVIAAAENRIVVSAASIWEIAIKRSIGKLAAPEQIAGEIAANGFEELAITATVADAVGTLPAHHKDPFDRMLVAQALAEGLTIVTADRLIPVYDVRTVNARS